MVFYARKAEALRSLYRKVMTKRVVLVEDDQLLRSLMVDLIEDVGAQCMAFGTSDDALVWMLKQATPVDLLIADQTTPGQLSGTDIAQLARQRWPALEIMVMSGHDASGLPEMPDNVRFIQKPLSIPDMLELVTEKLATA